ncbi:hypothetical protein [Neobacillus sp.]|uniref:hypothetical protein n=1 Tax=Neobacillus sp. TaxID=2675273 RepID=UPI00289EA9DD|nr:hypothetical protein [Neobacillus sp.]
MKFPKQVMGIKCNLCSREIETEWEQYTEDQGDYHECKECSFMSGRIDEKTYLQWSGHPGRNLYAGVNDGKVEIWSGSKTPPWERKRRKR